MDGGPALIFFYRFHEKLRTRIEQDKYGDNALQSDRILGYDADALHLLITPAIKSDMFCGFVECDIEVPEMKN